jgi:hypothetical protein
MAERRLALAIIKERNVESDVLIQWMAVLRRSFPPGPDPFTVPPGYIVNARNGVTELALQNREWDDFLWVDSDMLFAPDLGVRIRELTSSRYWQSPNGGVIAGCYYDRRPPFEIQLFTTRGDPEVEGIFFLQADVWIPLLAKAEQDYLARRPADLIKVAGGGTGIMLIRRDVIERLAAVKKTPRIWEARTPSEAMRKKFDREGKPITMWTEDINFCLEVGRLLGVQIMGDTDLRFSAAHMGSDRVGHEHYKASHMVFSGGELSLPKGYEVKRVEPASSPAPAG